MYQHGTPIVLNGKLLKNPNLASHYACMRHLGVIYGQTSQSLPPHGYVVLTLTSLTSERACQVWGGAPGAPPAILALEQIFAQKSCFPKGWHQFQLI